VTSSLSNRLAQTLDRDTLTDLLSQSLTQQMGIQRAALYLTEGEALNLQRDGDAPASISTEDELCKVLLESGIPVRSSHLWGLLSIPTNKRWNTLAWGELFVPMIFEGRMHGLLVLGTRSTSDVYSDQDIQIIATVAHQGALASANVQLVETLHGLTQRLVRTDESQRKEVARDLHDTVLQDLFFIKQRLHRSQSLPGADPAELLDETVQTLSSTIHNLRQTIKSQRPPLLDQGLTLALQDLTADMQRVAGDSMKISWQSSINGQFRLPDELATSIFRIAQEALSNALKHANARNVIVSLEQSGNVLRLIVEDDGVGMAVSLAEGALPLEEHHYGLAGMYERAMMIDAVLTIASSPGRGTKIALDVPLD
jgi:signal transduction histidine kinase